MDRLLIVGGGLAGCILATRSYESGIPFKWIISEKIPTASFAAYGMCNPVHFRNMVPAWKAGELYETSKQFFQEVQKKSDTPIFNDMPTHHLVVDPAEFIMWRQNVESTQLWKYTSGDMSDQVLPFVQNGYSGSIFIKDSFFVDIPAFVKATRKRYQESIDYSDFDHSSLQEKEEGVTYKSLFFDRIIFAEGSYGYANPYFTQVPFNPCKGQILVLRIPELKIEQALHKKVVLVPLGNQIFICGATYEWNDLNDTTTDDGRAELEHDLRDIIGDKYAYEVIDQKAGVRPTVSDRRPLVGWHPLHPAVGILNGFGTRGLLVGPSCANDLLNNLQNQTSILPDWDINRFKKRLLKNA